MFLCFLKVVWKTKFKMDSNYWILEELKIFSKMIVNTFLKLGCLMYLLGYIK